MEQVAEEVWTFGVKNHEDAIILHVSQVFTRIFFLFLFDFESEFRFSLQESPERAKQI